MDRSSRRCGGTRAVQPAAAEQGAPAPRPVGRAAGRGATSWYARRSVELLTGRRSTARRRRPLATLAGGGTIRFDRALIATGAEVRRCRSPAPMDRSRCAPRMMPLGCGARPSRPGRARRWWSSAADSSASRSRRRGLPGAATDGGRARSGAVGRHAGRRAGRVGYGRLTDVGVDLRLGARTTRFDEVPLVDDERLTAAFVVVGVGVRPRTGARGGGRHPGRRWRRRRRCQRTSRPAIWAAGDVARTDGRPRIEHWHAAREAGERAALSMLGRPVPPPPAPWVFSEIGGTPLDLIGAAEGWEEEAWLDEPDPSWPTFGAIASSGSPPSTVRSPRMWAGGSSTPVPHRPRWRSRWPDLARAPFMTHRSHGGSAGSASLDAPALPARNFWRESPEPTSCDWR